MVFHDIQSHGEGMKLRALNSLRCYEYINRSCLPFCCISPCTLSWKVRKWKHFLRLMYRLKIYLYIFSNAACPPPTKQKQLKKKNKVVYINITCSLFSRILGPFQSNVIFQADWTICGKKPLPSWPEKGKIEFKNYSVRYRDGLELVIKDLSIKLESGQKVNGWLTIFYSLFKNVFIELPSKNGEHDKIITLKNRHILKSALRREI